MARFEELEIGPGEASRRTACRRAARAVESGRVLAHPTGTVYGLGGLPTRQLDSRVASLKGRSPAESPLLRVARDIATLRRDLGDIRWDDRAERLAATFWPGPLTLVLPDGSALGTAVRVEGHAILRQVLLWLDGVISSTSLNEAGQPPAQTAAEARLILRELPDDEEPIVFLPSGDLPGPPPSTLVSLLGPATDVQRRGAIDEAAIRACLADVGS